MNRYSYQLLGPLKLGIIGHYSGEWQKVAAASTRRTVPQ
jgi:hypothetical protein